MEDKEMKTIDILMTSSGRLEYIKKAVESHLKYVHSELIQRWILHEDVINVKGSEEVLVWAKEGRMFSEIIVTKPAQRIGKAIQKIFAAGSGEYVFKTEDDWMITTDIDLDKMIEIMEVDKKINQIQLNKHPNYRSIGKFIPIEHEVLGQKLTLCHEWGMAPAMTRLSWIKPRWVCTQEGDGVNRSLKKNVMDRPPEWMKKNVGAYWLGGYGDRSKIFHIGHQSRRWERIEN